MNYQQVTVTQANGKSYTFVCPAFQDSKCIQTITFSEPIEQAPVGAHLSKVAMKTVSYLLSMMSLHLNYSLDKSN